MCSSALGALSPLSRCSPWTLPPSLLRVPLLRCPAPCPSVRPAAETSQHQNSRGQRTSRRRRGEERKGAREGKEGKGPLPRVCLRVPACDAHASRSWPDG